MLKGNFKKIIGIYLTISFAFVLALPVYAEPCSCKFNEATGHLIIGKDIENKKVTDIIYIPKDEIRIVTIEDGVTKISKNAFCGRVNLTLITIPNSVTKISERAFHRCTKLSHVVIPNSVRKIDNSAFNDCVELIKNSY